MNEPRIYTVTDAMNATGERDRHVPAVLIAERKIPHRRVGTNKAFDGDGYLALCDALREYRRENPSNAFAVRKKKRRRAAKKDA